MGNWFGRPSAVAIINSSRETPLLKGTVRFYQRPFGVLVEANISGLPGNGFFGFHIHDGGSCEGKNFLSAGNHYAPGGQMHPNHAGDLPPLLSYGGRAYMAVVTDRFSIREIIGKTIVIHRGSDDFRTQPGGNSGEKIGCGVIVKG